MAGYFNHTYYNTYYYANIINNVLEGDLELIGFISNFFDNNMVYHLIKPFQKRTAFHIFIECIVYDFFTDDMHEYDNRNYTFYKNNANIEFTPYAEKVLAHYGINGYSFGNQNINNYNEIEEYHTKLYESGVLENLCEKIADEIFYLMFNNRKTLLNFNYIVAQHMGGINLQNIDDEKDEEYEERKTYIKNSGTLKRVRIPEWCRKAVYFRDKGKCCLCHQDLSGTLSLNNQKHYDHIVPLIQGGLNDISNLQLLCSNCNLKKSGFTINTSGIYERWF